jgi:chitin disaccharide deacetylase
MEHVDRRLPHDPRGGVRAHHLACVVVGDVLHVPGDGIETKTTVEIGIGEAHFAFATEPAPGRGERYEIFYDVGHGRASTTVLMPAAYGWRMSEGAVQLVVQGDDFGMCHAVNSGIVRAFVDGIVQQSSVMVPCPWFAEAAHLALSHALPVGMHQTLTAEWDYLRWRPLTAGPTLARSIDGTFRKTVQSVIDKVTDDDATTELLAQAARAADAGLTLTYLDVHMGMSKPAAYDAVVAKTGARFLYPGLESSFPFTSIFQMSPFPPDVKREKLVDRIECIAGEPGVHLIVAHPAVASEELRSIAAAGAANAVWAEPYRVSDLELLCDPGVRARIDDLGIRLTPVATAQF